MDVSSRLQEEVLGKSPWLELLHASSFETSGSGADFSLCIGIGCMKGFLAQALRLRTLVEEP